MLRLSRRLVVLAVLCGGAGACLAPTLPLPPPGKPVIDGPDEAGQVRLTGYGSPGNLMIALNLSQPEHGDVQPVADDSTYELVFVAAEGDLVQLFYRAGTDESLPLEFTIPTRP